MKKLILVLILVMIPLASVTAGEYPWKTLPPFEMSYIDGYLETYDAGETINFLVEGRSSSIDVEPHSGFCVQAYITQQGADRNYAGANGSYDENKRAWVVSMQAPKDSSKVYELSVSLYCGDDQSPCATTYGRAAQIRKVLPLNIR